MSATHRPRHRVRRNFSGFARVAAIPGAVLLAAALVGGASYSSFSATAGNNSNSFTAATVALGADGSGSALFTVSNLIPTTSASAVSKCVKVTYSGNVNSAVKLYTSNYSSPTPTNTTTTPLALGNALKVKVEQGTGGGAFGDCTGWTADATNSLVYPENTLANFAGLTNFGSGVGTWTPSAAGTVKTFKVTYYLDGSVSNVNGTQAATASVNLVWEADSQ